MKKLILVLAVIAITVGAYAQTDSTNRKTSPQDMNNKQKQNLQNNPQDLNINQNQNLKNNPQDLNNTPKQNLQNKPDDRFHPDGVLLQNGKIMQVKNGQTTILENEMTLANGTKIMSDGTYIKKDGTRMRIKEGQHMDMSGNMTPIKTNKDKNMYLAPDSTIKKNK